MSALSHFVGFLAGLAGLFYLVVQTAHDTPKLAAATIYGCGVIAVFFASSVYHFFDLGTRGNAWLRRMDHVAIFLMIGGTYVPVCLQLLDGRWRAGMLIATGTVALGGSLMRLAWLECPRWIYTLVYLAMGWMAVVPAYRILPQLNPLQLSTLLGGGAMYSLGALIYLMKRPNPWPDVFGHHEIWHLFVLSGAILHFLFVTSILGQPYPPL